MCLAEDGFQFLFGEANEDRAIDENIEHVIKLI
jgi:hypothetical protein